MSHRLRSTPLLSRPAWRATLLALSGIGLAQAGSEAQPYISGMAPVSGPVGTVITVTGSGFTGARRAWVGNGHDAGLQLIDDAHLKLTVPADASSGSIAVLNAQKAAFSPTSFSLTGGGTTGGTSGGGTSGGGSTGGTSGGTTAGTTGGGDAIGSTAAARLLTQGSFGATGPALDAAAAQSYDRWFAAQASARPSLILPNVPNKDTNWLPFWWQNVITGPDQLRQRMAFALSELFVVSDQSAATANQAQAMAAWYDLLVRHALGNYRTLLERVTLSPAMGLYLNLMRSDRENRVSGVHADQNYARELMQLFSVGLVKLNLDGTLKTDASGEPIPTYGQPEVEAMAATLTGWGSNPTAHGGEAAWQYDIDYVNAMVGYGAHHDSSAKTLIGGARVPAGGSPASDLKLALDTLFEHPNVGPFIGRQLIQRLVTSNPSPAYVKRVASVFNDNGSGERGDLLAVARAILTDREAVTAGAGSSGKLREPLLRLSHLWRAFSAADSSGGIHEYAILQAGSDLFAESPLHSPTVFNFFAPDYQRPGSPALEQLVVPEFQITNENTLVLTNNQLQRQAYQFIDSAGNRHAGPNSFSEADALTGQSVLLQTAAWEALAASPARLVDRLDLVLMAGTMPTAMRSTLIDYVSGIPASNAANRVIEAADLIINSPQYAVQQ